MNRRSTSSPPMCAIYRDGASVRLELADGRIFVAETPAQLWADIETILGLGQRRALAGADREVVEPELVKDEDAYDHHEEDGGPGHQPQFGFDRESLLRFANNAGDVLEEAAGQEYGMLGRAAAQALRKNGQRIHDAISPRARRRGRRKLKGRG